jgi:protein-tyrosine kinase
MERIQNAIDKARKARQGHEAEVLRPTTTTNSAKSAPPVEEEAPEPEIAEHKAAPFVLPKDATLPAKGDAWAKLGRFDPKPAHLERKRIVAYQTGPDAVPYDVLRTRLLHQMRANNWKRVAVTSPAAGAGKTMTCVNLAFSLARQPDQRTMLIELDMRRPSMAELLGITGKKQFSNALSGKDAPEDHILRYGKNLAFAVNETTARNPAELLQGAPAARVLDEIEATYMPDIMIFDMPPIFASDDTMAFLDQVDCALLIGEAEKTTIEEIDRCEQELAARTNVLGVMLNKCRYLVSHEGYGNQYGY